jgi:hypothetical protein
MCMEVCNPVKHMLLAKLADMARIERLPISISNP